MDIEFLTFEIAIGSKELCHLSGAFPDKILLDIVHQPNRFQIEMNKYILHIFDWLQMN